MTSDLPSIFRSISLNLFLALIYPPPLPPFCASPKQANQQPSTHTQSTLKNNPNRSRTTHHSSPSPEGSERNPANNAKPLNTHNTPQNVTSPSPNPLLNQPLQTRAPDPRAQLRLFILLYPRRQAPLRGIPPPPLQRQAHTTSQATFPPPRRAMPYVVPRIAHPAQHRPSHSAVRAG